MKGEPVEYAVFFLRMGMIIILLVLNIFIWGWPVLPSAVKNLFPLQLLDVTFTLVCHRIPARSFWIHGAPVALCHRCSGIYLGVLIGFIAGLGIRFHTIRTVVRMVVFFSIFMGIQWLGEVLAFWNMPWLRFMSGIGFGVSVGFLLQESLRELTRTESHSDRDHLQG